MANTDGRPTLDLEDGLDRAGGDLEFYKELIGMFLEDTPLRLTEITDAIARGDAAAVGSVAHGIKGAAANLSALAIRDTAYALESLGRSGSLAGAPELADQLAHEIRRLTDLAPTL